MGPRAAVRRDDPGAGRGCAGPGQPVPVRGIRRPRLSVGIAAVVEHRDPANGTALVLGVLGGVAAAVVLGVAGTVGVFRRRRAEPAAPETVRAGGLFRDEREEPEPSDD
ncbi:MAG: hypothetical protein U0Q04_03505 [Microbacterium sp.]